MTAGRSTDTVSSLLAATLALGVASCSAGQFGAHPRFVDSLDAAAEGRGVPPAAMRAPPLAPPFTSTTPAALPAEWGGGLFGAAAEQVGPHTDLGKAVPFGASMNRPRKISGREVEYSAEARQKGVEGTAFVKCVVEVDGRLTSCVIEKSLPPLDGAILAAVATWRMTPVVSNGQPIAVSYTFPIRFKLDAGSAAPASPAPASSPPSGVGGGVQLAGMMSGGVMREERLAMGRGWRGTLPQAFVLFRDGMNRPEKTAGRMPTLSPAARATHPNGVVRVLAVIGADGHVIEAWLDRGLPSVEVEVMEALRTWQMTPVLKDGRPTYVGYWLEFAVGSGPFPPIEQPATRFTVAP